MSDHNVHYIHRLSYTARERLVGAFVLSAFLIGALLFVYSGQATQVFAPKFTLIARLRTAEGLAPDAKVFISGVQVGRVRSIDITESNDIRLTLELLEKFHPMVRGDSRASLSKLAMIGNASIEIRAGNPGLELLPDGALIPVDEPLSVDQLVAEAVPVLKDFKHVVQQLDAILGAVDPKDVRASVQSLRVSLAHVEALTGSAGAQKDVPLMLSSARGAAGDLQSATRDLPELMQRVRVLVEQLNVTLRAIQGTWPVSSSVPEETVPPLLVNPAPQP